MENKWIIPTAVPKFPDAMSTSEHSSSLSPISDRKQYSPRQQMLKSASHNALSLLRDIFPKAFLFMVLDEEHIVVESSFKAGYSFHPSDFSCEKLAELGKAVLTASFSDGSGKEAKFLYSKLVDQKNFFYGFILAAFYINDIGKTDRLLLGRVASMVSNTCLQQRLRNQSEKILEEVVTPWLIISPDGRIVGGQHELKKRIESRININEFLQRHADDILNNDEGSLFAHINIENLTGDYEIIYSKLKNGNQKIIQFKTTINNPEEYLAVCNRYMYSPYINNIIKLYINQKTLIPLLIEAEDGTEKEYVARTLGLNGKPGPFIYVDCAKLSSLESNTVIFGSRMSVLTGKLEQANNGTLFLDHIDHLAVHSQNKLAYFLQHSKTTKYDNNLEYRLNVNVICSVSSVPEEAVNKGTLTHLLYDQFKNKIKILPLRARKQDIEFYSDVELKLRSARIVFDDYAHSFIHNYHWPRNIDQLRYVYRTMIEVHGNNPYITTQELERMFPFIFLVQRINSHQTRKNKDASEREKIENALIQNQGRVKDAAKTLKICRATFYNKMKLYGINPKNYRKTRTNTPHFPQIPIF